MTPGELILTRLGELNLWQPRTGYRFSIDSVLLAAFASPRSGPVADLGAGCGVLCALLARRGLAGPGLTGPFLALEQNPVAALACQRNFTELGLPGQTLAHDLRQPHPQLKAGGFSLVISNPPFGRSGEGRLPPDPGRAAARHELTLSMEELAALAGRLLRPAGRLALCVPPRRLPQVLAALTSQRLGPQRLRLVHGREGKPASLALIEAVKNGGDHLKVEAPLTVFAQGQTYAPEVAAIYQELTGRA